METVPLYSSLGNKSKTPKLRLKNNQGVGTRSPKFLSAYSAIGFGFQMTSAFVKIRELGVGSKFILRLDLKTA